MSMTYFFFFFFQAEDGIRDIGVTGVQTCALPIYPKTQYRIGSITKTMTAAMVMQLRDEGYFSLDDLLYRHLPGTPIGGVTLRPLPRHVSRLPRRSGEHTAELQSRPYLVFRLFL